jgi:alpha-ribazole phosphatase
VLKRLILVRHGEMDRAAEGRFVGRTDMQLSEAGCRAAARLTDSVSRVMPAVCYTSPLSRSRETAKRALAPLHGEARTDEGLREIDFGRWEGQSFEQVQAADGELVHAWLRDEGRFQFPGGESVEAFRSRVASAAERLVSDPAATAIVFTHLGVIRTMICHWLRVSHAHHRAFHVAYASLSVLSLEDGRGVLKGRNLRDLDQAWL